MAEKLPRFTQISQADFNLPRPRIKKAYLIGLWIIPAILSTNSFYLKDFLKGEEASWLSIFAVQLLVWSLWAGFTPLILWLGRKFRIERPHWLKGIIFHIFSSIFLVLIYLVFYAFILGFVNQAALSFQSFINTYVGLFIALFHWDILIYWSILGIGYAFDYYNKYREWELQTLQLEKQLVQAQLHTLKSQLQPHFLFNTLHTIGGLVRYNKKDDAVKMLAGLSDLLRLSLENIGKQEVSLKEEIAFLERYLEIQQMRFRDRLKVNMVIAPETLESKVPALILQPIVENAIRHGFDKLRTAEHFKITAAKNNGALNISVYNDGPVLPEHWNFSKNQGVGLANTRQRLQQLYGDAAVIELQNVDHQGVTALITLPFLFAEEKESDEK